MINGNSFQSVAIVLLMFGVIYFVALGIYELAKLLKKHRNKKEDDSSDR